jgi:hypothetical protein
VKKIGDQHLGSKNKMTYIDGISRKTSDYSHHNNGNVLLSQVRKSFRTATRQTTEYCPTNFRDLNIPIGTLDGIQNISLQKYIQKKHSLKKSTAKKINQTVQSKVKSDSLVNNKQSLNSVVDTSLLAKTLELDNRNSHSVINLQPNLKPIQPITSSTNYILPTINPTTLSISSDSLSKKIKVKIDQKVKSVNNKNNFSLSQAFTESLQASAIKDEKNDNLSKFQSFLATINVWKFSLVGAMIFGMIVMSFIYHNLGEVALAKINTQNNSLRNQEIEEDVLYFSQDKNFHNRGTITDEEKQELEKKMREMVAGYPIENMLPYILEQDYYVAAYLIAIAKQESQWGKHSPVLNGKDCYNYWGYRENRDLMGSAGHTCFNSRKDAVETVGARLDKLLYKYNRQTPSSLIVWKCGSSCDGHSQVGVNRWINTVNMYYNKLVNN